MGQEKIETTWELVFILNNLTFSRNWENDYLAIIGPKDERYSSIKEQSPTTKKLLSNFVNQRKQSFSPPILIRKSNYPRPPKEPDSILAFRNILAISSIVKGWGISSTGCNALYSDYFDLYPLVPGKQGTIHTISSAMHDFDMGSRPFLGQNSPHLPIDLSDVWTHTDELLLESLHEIWKGIFIGTTQETWTDTALFRSLQMAYRAFQCPVRPIGSIYDYGTHLVLFASACEILCHPEKGDVGPKEVLELLHQYPFCEKRLRHKRYKFKRETKAGKIVTETMTLAQKLYSQIYDLRNDFIHGNKVTDSSLRASTNKKRKPLTWAMPIIYRTLLYAFLKKNYQPASLTFDDIKAGNTLRDYITDPTNNPAFARKFYNHTINRCYEEALLQYAP